MTDRIEAERLIPADAAAIFAVLTDPQGHVAIDSSGMLMSAEGDRVKAVGDSFTVHMDRDSLRDFDLGLYDVEVSITAFEADRLVEWTILGNLKIGHRYGYTLEPQDNGTLVTSYCDWSTISDKWRASGIFPVISDGALRATLGILARTVAPGVPRPV